MGTKKKSGIVFRCVIFLVRLIQLGFVSRQNFVQACTILSDPPSIRPIGRDFLVPLHPFQMIEDGEQGLHGAQKLADFKRLERFDEGLIQSLIGRSRTLIAEAGDYRLIVIDRFGLRPDARRYTVKCTIAGNLAA